MNGNLNARSVPKPKANVIEEAVKLLATFSVKDDSKVKAVLTEMLAVQKHNEAVLKAINASLMDAKKGQAVLKKERMSFREWREDEISILDIGRTHLGDAQDAFALRQSEFEAKERSALADMQKRRDELADKEHHHVAACKLVIDQVKDVADRDIALARREVAVDKKETSIIARDERLRKALG